MNSRHFTVCMNVCAYAYASLQSLSVNLFNVNIYDTIPMFCVSKISLSFSVNSRLCDKHAPRTPFQTE